MPLTVLCPALRLGDVVVASRGLHAGCWEIAEERGLIPPLPWTQEQVMRIYADHTEGFQLSDGRFVGREEARDIALGNQQTDLDYLDHSGVLHAPDFQQSEPIEA